MKVNGIDRKLDQLGRLVIPKEMRYKLNLNEHSKLDMIVEGNTLLVRKAEYNCIICSNEVEERNIVKNTFVDLICYDCIEQIAQFYETIKDHNKGNNEKE